MWCKPSNARKRWRDGVDGEAEMDEKTYQQLRRLRWKLSVMSVRGKESRVRGQS